MMNNRNSSKKIHIDECPLCTKPHDFKIDIADIYLSRTYSLTVTCPDKEKNFKVTIRENKVEI